MSNLKAGTQNGINLVRCHDSTTIEGNPYLISQTTAIILFKQCFSFRLRRHQIHTISQFTTFFFLFFLSIREHCHSTCLVQAWIEMTREKLLPELSPDTAVGKTQNEHFILAKSVFFHYLYSWIQQLQVTLQAMLSKMDKESEDRLKFWSLVSTSVLPLSASQHCCNNANLLQV